MDKVGYYIKLFCAFFKIGLFTIGGGLAMVPIMREEFINRYKWLNDEELTDIFALSQSMPGAIAVNAATMIGYRLNGFVGAAVATLGTILPSFIIVLFIALFLKSMIVENSQLDKIFSGINAGITALILAATVKMAKSSVKDWFGIVLAFVGFFATLFLVVDIAILVVSAAILGYIYYSRQEKDN